MIIVASQPPSPVFQGATFNTKDKNLRKQLLSLNISVLSTKWIKEIDPPVTGDQCNLFF